MGICRQRLDGIFNAAGKCRIAVLGDLMLDVYVSGTASRLSQEAPVPVLRVNGTENRPGGAANVMRNLVSLGAGKVYAFGIVGDDAAGDRLKGILRDSGIDSDGILSTPDRQTTVKQRVIASGQQVVRMDYEDTSEAAQWMRKWIASRITGLIVAGQVDAVILQDYAKGLLSQEMVQSIVDTANQHGVFTSLDPHPGHGMCISGLSLMTPNRSQAFGLAGIRCTEPCSPVGDDMHLFKAASNVIEEWYPAALLITLGDQGMALFSRQSMQDPFIIPTVARQVFDVSGAGDTVIATYTLCHAAGADDIESAVISNQAAGIVVGKAGTAVTGEDEIRRSFGFPD